MMPDSKPINPLDESLPVNTSISPTFYLGRPYTRASTPVSPQVSMTSASGVSSSSTTTLSRDKDSEFLARPLSVPNLVAERAGMTAIHRGRFSPSPKLGPHHFYNRRESSVSVTTPETNDIERGLKGSPTEHLIRQIFLPKESKQLDWRDRLPTLSSSDKVNIEIYALFGLICRQFIQSWYYQIVDDPKFLYDISSVLAQIVKQLEERMRRIDAFEFLLDDVPLVLETHINDVRLVNERFGSSLLQSTSYEAAFHSIRPHPALDDNEAETLYLRQLAKGITFTLLDEANTNTPLASSLISTMICDLGLKNAIEKLSEPWMLYEIFTKVIDLFAPPISTESVDSENIVYNKTIIDFGSLQGVMMNPTTVTVQAGLLYKRAAKLCGSILAKGGRLFAFLGSFATGTENTLEKERPAVISVSFFNLINTIFQLSLFKPMIPATLNFVTIPLTFGKLRKVSNRVVAFYLDKFLCNEGSIASIIKIVRNTLFPNAGSMGPGRVFPTEAEQESIRQSAYDAIYRSFPEAGKTILLGNSPEERINEFLDLFENKNVNKHLVYTLLELVISRIAPELTEMTPEEILAFK